MCSGLSGFLQIPLLTEIYIKSLKRYFLTLNYKFLIFECQDDFGHQLQSAHDVIRPTYASDPPEIALSRPNGQEYRCARDCSVLSYRATTTHRGAKWGHLPHSRIPAHLVVTGPSRANRKRTWDELRREHFGFSLRIPTDTAIDRNLY